VNATGYIINAILVLLVLRQIRGSRLDLASLVLPVVLVAGAAAYYLRSGTGGRQRHRARPHARRHRGRTRCPVRPDHAGMAGRRRGRPGQGRIHRCGPVGGRHRRPDGVRLLLRSRSRARDRALLCRAQHHRRERLGSRARHDGPGGGQRAALHAQGTRSRAARSGRSDCAASRRQCAKAGAPCRPPCGRIQPRTCGCPTPIVMLPWPS
jgi:hypothetical protein